MIIADLHLHSRFSRATSKQLNIESLEKWAKVKGLNLLGTGDFTHPEWIKELKNNLSEENGILKSKNGMNFVLQTEVSLIYTDLGSGKRVHNLILAPNFDVVDQITEYFKKHGRVDYDGRPIFKIQCSEMVENLMSISDDIEVIPAHIWTPWFSLLGSMSGYDSVEDAFKDQVKHIHALETGLSSDPEMNWRLSALDKYALVSSSDSHSFWPWRIGREATLFDIYLRYKNLINALRTKEGLKGTIEVDPGYGKYHENGHRNCGICLSPTESKKINNICPVCRRKLTIGVHHRVDELADRDEGFKLDGAPEFKRLIPLSEIISSLFGVGIATRKVWDEFNKLMNSFGSCFNVLLNVSEDELKNVVDEKLARMIIKNRNNEIKIKPGFDGEYGKPVFDGEVSEMKVKKTQASLGDF